MYKIGEFSTISKVSIKTLHHYHDVGLLQPVSISETGYRYYDDRSFERLLLIRRLRDLDFSIPEITDLLARYESGRELYEMLQRKLTDVGKKAREYRIMERELKILLAEQGNPQPPAQPKHRFEVMEVKIPGQLVLGTRFVGAYQEIGPMFGRLFRAGWKYYAGQATGLFFDSEYKETGADCGVAITLKQPLVVEGLETYEIEPITALSLFHEGSYDTISSTYRQLFSYSNDHGYQTLLPSREIYHKGPGGLFPRSPKRYLTEILVPIEKGMQL